MNKGIVRTEVSLKVLDEAALILLSDQWVLIG